MLNRASLVPAERSAKSARHPSSRPKNDDLRQGLALRLFQQRRPAGRHRVDQPVRTGGIEPQHPIANRLETDTTKLRRFAAVPPSQITASANSRRTWFASRLDRASSQPRRREILSKRHRQCHRKPPSVCDH